MIVVFFLLILLSTRNESSSFSTDEQLTLLFKAKQVMMDGTFDACPPHFDQIYTLHAIKHGRCKSLSSLLSCQLAFILFSLAYPCAIALLSGRSTTIYRQLFNELESQATRLQLDFISGSDYVRLRESFDKNRSSTSELFSNGFLHTHTLSLSLSLF